MAQPSAHWPHDRDDDPPLGLSIRPLHQLPDLDQPLTPTMPAVPPLVGEQHGGSFGTPGGSATAHYQRARAHEWASFARSLPWRLAAVIAAGALAHPAGPRLAGPAAALAAATVGWRLRFRTSAETAAWRRGARGERRTARHLRKLVRAGWTILHDLAVPGSRANGDHLLIGPPGVFLIDSKAWHGHITQAIDGSAWHNGHPVDQTIATVRWEAEQVAGALGAPVLPLLCVHDTRIPWDEIYVDNVPVLTPHQAAGPAAVAAGPHGPGRGDVAGRARPPAALPCHVSQASLPGSARGDDRAPRYFPAGALLISPGSDSVNAPGPSHGWWPTDSSGHGAAIIRGQEVVSGAETEQDSPV